MLNYFLALSPIKGPVELLEHYGLLSVDQIFEAVSGLPARKIFRLSEDLESLVRPNARATGHADIGTFNFLASSSIRGDLLCTAWGCKSRKLATLSRIAALYADQVCLPISTGIIKQDSAENREELGTALATISVMRPLIESGLVILTPPGGECYCPECLKSSGIPMRQLRRKATAFWREHADRFQAIYRPPSIGETGPVVELTGPTDFLEHRMIYELFESPKWEPHRFQHVGGKPGAILSPSLLKRSNLLEGLCFSELTWDLVAQQIYGLKYGTKHLTDLPGEAEFYSASGDQMQQGMAALCEALTHSIPLLPEIPLRTLIQVRQQEADAFVAYRAALGGILRNHVQPGRPISARDAQQICGDELSPKLAELRMTAKALTRSTRQKAIAKVTTSAAVLGIGVFGGLLPASLKTILGAVGGISLLREVAETLASLERYPSQVRSHNLFFLLRLEQSI
jgi:hypothetical protein